MRCRILDMNGDYQFGKGNQQITYGIYAVRQAIQTRLKLLQEEWFEDIEDGLPFFQQIAGKAGTDENKMIADSLIKSRIIGTTDVTGIKSFTSNFNTDTRKYSCYGVASSLYGDVYFNF